MLLADGVRILFALLAVLGLIGLAAMAASKAGLMSASGGFVRKRRLKIVETLAIDARRRVAIVKCDDAEHLVILGANGETVIEKNLPCAPELAEPASAPENPFPALAEMAQKLRPRTKDAA